MVNIYVLVIVLLLSISPAKAIFGWGDNDDEQNQTPVPQQTIPQQQPIPQQPIPRNTRYNNYGGLGTVTGVINRFPRRFDRQTLINSGPGLIQDAVNIFQRYNNRQPNPQQQIPQQQIPQSLPPTQPQAPQIQVPELIAPQVPQIINPHNPVPDEEELFIGNDPPPLNETEPLMLPAPKPGYIIRYNKERGVYEEVREIPITPIQHPQN